MNIKHQTINLEQKLSLFTEHWQPKVIAELNDYQFKLAKVKGDFVWHSHQDTDEAFIVLKGQLRINLRDGFVDVKEGEMYVVKKGAEHKPYAQEEAHIMLIEPKGVINTGENTESDITAENDVWV